MTDHAPSASTGQHDAEAFQPPDLTGFLGGHDVMRTQFALLARAAGEVGERDSRRSAALDDHLRFMTRRLTAHHQQEDDSIWPQMRALDPTLLDLLDDMEQDHHQLDEILAITGDTSTALTKRAAALRDLHRTLAAHLDREEAEAVPAIRRLIPASAWALEDQRFQAELGADRKTTLVWILGHLPPPARAGMLATLPLPARVLYRTVWRPQYLRQVRLLYGSAVMTTTSRRTRRSLPLRPAERSRARLQEAVLPACGLAGVLLTSLGMSGVGDAPDPHETAATMADHFTRHRQDILAAAPVGLVGAVLLLAFCLGLGTLLRDPLTRRQNAVFGIAGGLLAAYFALLHLDYTSIAYDIAATSPAQTKAMFEPTILAPHCWPTATTALIWTGAWAVWQTYRLPRWWSLASLAVGAVSFTGIIGLRRWRYLSPDVQQQVCGNAALGWVAATSSSSSSPRDAADRRRLSTARRLSTRA